MTPAGEVVAVRRYAPSSTTAANSTAVTGETERRPCRSSAIPRLRSWSLSAAIVTGTFSAAAYLGNRARSARQHQGPRVSRIKHGVITMAPDAMLGCIGSISSI